MLVLVSVMDRCKSSPHSTIQLRQHSSVVFCILDDEIVRDAFWTAACSETALDAKGEVEHAAACRRERFGRGPLE